MQRRGRETKKRRFVMQLNRILCAVDFSEASHLALEQAASLAQTSGATLVALHVVEPLLMPGEYGALLEAPRDIEVKAGDNAGKALSDLVSVRLKGRVRVETK